jgi:putative amide transporter protein
VSAVALFFIGAVLLCNGLTLLGRIQPKGAAPVNALVGIVLVAASAHLGVPSGATESDWSARPASCCSRSRTCGWR